MNILVLGLGVSGRAVATLLLREGHTVVGVDKDPQIVAQSGFEAHLEGVLLDLDRFDQVVVSPGISPETLLYSLAKRRGIPLIGEAAFALQRLSQKCLGITGTNGKTTVTLLTEHLLKACGKRARSVGNVGYPLSAYLLEADPEEILVVELSSYQLETMEGALLDAAVILNITPDHLDRYASMQAYGEAKWQIARCLKPGAPLYVQEGALQFGTFPLASIFREENYALENRRAAELLLSACDLGEEDLAPHFATFQRPSHRIEYVLEKNGIHFYDDSKGTNVDAVVQAVKSMERPVILIAGGVDKGASYAPWADFFPGKVKKIVLIGEAAEKIYRELEKIVTVEIVHSLDIAVHRAYAMAESGDSILLSPGCSSFDQFRDYVHRGEVFQSLVRNL